MTTRTPAEEVPLWTEAGPEEALGSFKVRGKASWVPCRSPVEAEVEQPSVHSLGGAHPVEVLSDSAQMQGPAAAGEHAEVDVLSSGDDALGKNEPDFFGEGVLDPDQQVPGGARGVAEVQHFQKLPQNGPAAVGATRVPLSPIVDNMSVAVCAGLRIRDPWPSDGGVGRGRKMRWSPRGYEFLHLV